MALKEEVNYTNFPTSEQLEKAINQLDKAGTSTSTDPESQLTDERSDAEQSGSEDTDMAV